jgi:hypothetical protein
MYLALTIPPPAPTSGLRHSSALATISLQRYFK